MLDCGGEETERGAQCPLGVSKSAESGLVPDLKETLADMQSLPAFQTTRHTHRHQSSLSPNTNTLTHSAVVKLNRWTVDTDNLWL